MYVLQMTFLIDWKSANKYPALVIFYINGCFMVSCIGWLVQFTPGSRDVIICRKDGTLRTREPRYVSRMHCNDLRVDLISHYNTLIFSAGKIYRASLSSS